MLGSKCRSRNHPAKNQLHQRNLTTGISAGRCLRGGLVGAVALAGMPSGAAAQWDDASIGAAVIVAAFVADAPVRRTALVVQNPMSDAISSFGNAYGDWHTTLPIFAGVGIAIGASGGREAWESVAAGAAGVAAASMANELVNRAIGRHRPNADEGPWSFAPMGGHASFGSGHATYAFAVAGVVDELTTGRWVAPLYVAAALTGASRICSDRHWVSDVAFGAAVGIMVSRMVARTVADRLGAVGSDGAGADAGGGLEADHEKRRVSWVLSPGFAGITLRAPR